MADLVPARFEAHVHRIFAEHAAQASIYDLPVRKFWLPNPRFDSSVRFHGARAATPVGPAAGPHTQLAQNLVLSWLAGARILELKTVQINDSLVIPRPCIDAATIGFNVEWSQELRLTQSAEEYIRGWTLIHALAQSGLDGLPADRDVLFDLSVGYDLEGVRSAPIRRFVESLQDARARIDALRRHLPARLRECEIPARIVDCATISTFHGCPADQIAAIAEHLMEAHGLHVVVKLNPTLLGHADVLDLLHERLGYTELRVPRAAFDSDLQFPDALAMIRHLRGFAAARGLHFGVKLTNTLVVENHKAFFNEETMYLSGQPLHVLAMTLLQRLRTALASDFPELPVSFSAGIDKGNFADAVALGLVPVTVCTDLLRTGGYGRLPAYLRELDARMHAVGAVDVASFIRNAHGMGAQAATELGPGASTDAITARAAFLNTGPIVEAVRSEPRYQAARNAKPPKKIGRMLALFDCTNCDKCVPVCPNDANFEYALPAGAYAVWVLTWDGSDVAAEALDPLRVAEDHQLANYADFCNECGNCDVFCPEDGGPYAMKPRFFGSTDEMARHPARDGVVVHGPRRATARFGGRTYTLDGERFADGHLTVRLRVDAPPELLEAAGPTPPGHRLETAAGVLMGLLCDAVLDGPGGMNPIRAEIEAGEG